MLLFQLLKNSSSIHSVYIVDVSVHVATHCMSGAECSNRGECSVVTVSVMLDSQEQTVHVRMK